MYELRKEYAMKVLNRALEFNKVGEFLVGAPYYEIDTHNTMGESVHDSYLVMKTIYDKYRENSECGIDKLVYEAMIKILRTEVYEPDILNLLSDIEFQLMSEKQNIAPFKLNCIELLKEVRNNIERNKIRFQNDQFEMWRDLENHDEIINTHYGHRIL